jgi:hypothetical protein
VSDYEHCLHTENTGQKRLVRPVEEPSNNADNEDNFERSENITDSFNFLWIRDHGRDQEWHVVKLRQYRQYIQMSFQK